MNELEGIAHVTESKLVPGLYAWMILVFDGPKCIRKLHCEAFYSNEANVKCDAVEIARKLGIKIVE